MPQNNLRDNPDGTCNCRPLGKSCFFTDPYDEDGRCDCKCHFSKQNSGEKNPRCRECVKEKCSTCWDCHNALCDIHIQESEKEIMKESLKKTSKAVMDSTPESGGWKERFDMYHSRFNSQNEQYCNLGPKGVEDLKFFISQEISSAEERGYTLGKNSIILEELKIQKGAEERAIEKVREIAENLIKNTNEDNQFIPCPRCKGSPTSYPCLCQIYRQGLYDFLSEFINLKK